MDEEDRYTRITLRIPKDLDRKLQESADATSKSKNAEIIARLEESFGPPVDMSALSAAIEDQRRLSDVYRIILARVGRIIDDVGEHMPTDPDAIRAVETLLILVGDRLQNGRMSNVSDALLEADEISSQYTMAKTRLAHIEAKAANNNK